MSTLKNETHLGNETYIKTLHNLKYRLFYREVFFSFFVDLIRTDALILQYFGQNADFQRCIFLSNVFLSYFLLKPHKKKALESQKFSTSSIWCIYTFWDILNKISLL